MATILIVDDRADNRRFLSTLIGCGGHRLLEAADGAEALALVGAERPDLLITDIMMPVMDGYEFVHRLRGVPELGATPVIFYTATYGAADAEAMARSCGVLEVLPKPSRPQAILDAVNRALGVQTPVAGGPELDCPADAPVEWDPGEVGSRMAAYLDELRSPGFEPGKFIAVQRFTGRMIAMQELAARLMAEREPAALVRLFVKAARRIVGARYAAIGMLDWAQRAIADLRAEGFDGELLRQSALDRGRLPGALLERKLPLRAAVGAEALPAGHPEVIDFLGMPIAGREGSYGWMYFASGPGGEAFSEEDEQIAVVMAAQLAMLYENAAQHHAIQQHAAKLQVEVAERKIAQDTLREREAVLHRAQDMAKLAHVITGPDGAFESWSESLPKLIGVDPAQMPRSTREWLGLLHPDDRAVFRATSIAARSTGRRTDIAYRLRRADGAWIHAQQVLEPLEGAADAKGGKRWFNTLQDVSREKLAAEALRESEERLGAMLQQAAVGMAQSDLGGRLLAVNAKFCEMIGHAQPEAMSLEIRDLTHPDDLQKTLAARERLLAGTSATYEKEARVLRKDGSHLWATITTTLVRGADGTASHFISVLHDVTERRKLEDQMRRAELMYRAIFENAVEGIFLVDAKGQVMSSNPRLARMLGFASPDDLSRDIGSAAHEVYVERNGRRRFREMLDAQGVVEDFETEWRRKDGSTFWVSLTGRQVREETGGLIHYLGMARDITERKLQQDRIRRLNRVYAVLSAINTLIVRVTDRRELYREVCRIAVELGGFPIAWIGEVDREAMRVEPLAWQGTDGSFLARVRMSIGDDAPEQLGLVGQAVRNCAPVISNDIWGDPRITAKGAAESGSRSLAVLPMVLGDQTKAVLILHAASVGFFDDEEMKLLSELAGNIALALDHLERNRYIVELSAARAEAEQANRAKSAFLATMSHEIRTPMNGVIGMVEVLAQGKLSEQQRDLINTVRDSGSALLGIIDDILDFSKIEAGRMEIDRTSVSVAALAESLADALSPLADKRGVDLYLFVSPAVPEPVIADAVRMRQLLYNLVGNAIKFSGGRPDLRGRVSMRVEVAAGAPPRLRFSVTDNGIGMTFETLSGLFTPFTQAEVSTTRRFGGTGLGLAICKRLVELMQGEIGVQSSFGKGSTFTVTLPLEAAPGETAPLLDLRGIDCVVVAGATVDADDMRAYLEHGGARVQVAVDLDHAAQLAAGTAAPVVLADAGREAIPVNVLRAAFVAAPDARFVLIGRGRRSGARIEAPEVVRLDGGVLRQRALLRAVLVASGRASPEVWHGSARDRLLAEGRVAPSVAEARAAGRLILVAEDDEINQKVILQQLGLLGYAAEIAADGAEALRMWRSGKYAMLLTDLHMPEMDGYELAQRIRAEEDGTRRMPILALTANALRGEAIRARAAGVDEYLTKPVQLRVLAVELEKWLPRTGPSSGHVRTADPAGGRQARLLDVSALKAIVGGDPATVKEFLAEYRTSARRLATELRAACAVRDARQVGAIAHKLKSSSRSVGALALGDLCAGMENAGRSADKAAMVQGLPAFEAAFAAVEAEIDRLLPAP